MVKMPGVGRECGFNQIAANQIKGNQNINNSHQPNNAPVGNKIHIQLNRTKI